MPRILVLILLFSPRLDAAQISTALFDSLKRFNEVHAIVLLATQSDPFQIAAMQQAVIQGAALTDRVTYRWQFLPGFSVLLDADALARLADEPYVEAVGTDLEGGGNLVESRSLIGADPVYLRGYSGAGTTVAVLDSGVDLTHPDLRDRLIAQHCFCRNADGTGCCPDGSIEQGGPGSASDENGHGTHVAGIIASRGTIAPRGVAPGVRLVAVRVLDRVSRFSGTSQVLAALDWIITNQPTVRLVNMSLGTDARFSGHCDVVSATSRAFSIALNILNARGVSVMVSTGNSSSAIDVQLPACIGRALAVGAVYDSDVGSVSPFNCIDPVTAADQVSCFSNSSMAVDLLAPGAPITSTSLGGLSSTFFGTSMAAPHATAAAAILLGINPGLTAETIELILERSGRPVVDGRNGLITPRIDLLSAVAEVERPTSPRRRAARR